MGKFDLTEEAVRAAAPTFKLQGHYTELRALCLRIADDALGSLLNGDSATNALDGFFYGARHYPEMIVAGEGTIADYPTLLTDMYQVGQLNFVAWIGGTMIQPPEYDWFREQSVRRCLHSYFTTIKAGRLVFQAHTIKQIRKDFVNAGQKYNQRTQYLSTFFNGIQGAGIEIYALENFATSPPSNPE